MIPIRDEIPTRRIPVVNYALIAVNILVFVIMWLSGASQESSLYRYAMVPADFAKGVDLGDVISIFTSMFMHAGFAHIAGNMLYLWIFGDNIEDYLGHLRYLVFYLVGGAVASLAHILTNPTSQTPTVGASGAIAAVLGAYLVLFPRSRIATFIPIGFFMRLTMVPAIIVLGFWFVLQLFSGVMSIGGPEVGGVAYWAHIGGFVVGVVMAKLLGSRRRPESAITW